MVMRIRELRLNQNMQQKLLAENMGVLQSVVSNWESETALPKTRQLPLLAKILGVSIDDLFTDSTLKQPDGLPAIGDTEKEGKV